MSDIKKKFLDSAELLQGNSAKYLEQMHAKYSDNANELDLKWQEFFMNFNDSANLKDTTSQNRATQGLLWSLWVLRRGFHRGSRRGLGEPPTRSREEGARLWPQALCGGNIARVWVVHLGVK